MNDREPYEQRLQAIRACNYPLLKAFEQWLEQKGLTDETIITHVGNLHLFGEYLVYYEPLKRLDEAKAGDVWMFLADWFPRKALWASRSSVKAYCASFKKFFLWLGETGHASPEIVADVISTLKEERRAFLAAVTE